MQDTRLTSEIVMQALGDTGAAKVAAIVATEATVEEFEEALAWASGESDVMTTLERPAAGNVAVIYEILTADDDAGDERR